MLTKLANPTSRIRTVKLPVTRGEGEYAVTTLEEFKIEFNFYAYDAMKQLTGISLLKGWDDAELDAREYACLLFSGLVYNHQEDEDPTVDLNFCYLALSDGDFVEIVRILFEAYKASLPKPKDGPANPKKPMRRKS